MEVKVQKSEHWTQYTLDHVSVLDDENLVEIYLTDPRAEGHIELFKQEFMAIVNYFHLNPIPCE